MGGIESADREMGATVDGALKRRRPSGKEGRGNNATRSESRRRIPVKRFRLKVTSRGKDGPVEEWAEFEGPSMAEELEEEDGKARHFLAACWAQGGVMRVEVEEIEPECKPMGAA